MSRELRTPTHNATLTVCLCKAGYSCIPLKSAATSLWTMRDVKVVLMVKMVSGVLRRSECFCVCSCDRWNRCVSSGIVFPPTDPQRAAAVTEWGEKWFQVSSPRTPPFHIHLFWEGNVASLLWPYFWHTWPTHILPHLPSWDSERRGERLKLILRWHLRLQRVFSRSRQRTLTMHKRFTDMRWKP